MEAAPGKIIYSKNQIVKAFLMFFWGPEENVEGIASFSVRVEMRAAETSVCRGIKEQH
jgi:hypothetical protein